MSFGQQTLEDRIATQNALFEEQYQADLKVAPERATAVGDYRYNDRLAERSLAAIAERHEMDRRFLEWLRAIQTAGFAEQDVLSHDLMVRMLEQRDADYKLKDYEMPVSQMDGPHTGLPDFDVKTCHDEMLSGGVLPLDLLDSRTDAWIAGQKTTSAAAGQ